MTKIGKSADFASVGTQIPIRITSQNTGFNTAQKVPFSGGVLDTLAQPAQNGVQRSNLLTLEDARKFSKRARSKYLTRSYLFKLIDLDSELKKSYWSTYHCAAYLEQKEDRLTSRYCNGRWCLTCNRIRIAKAINAYKDTLDNFVNPMFVTLTNKNCTANELHLYIDNLLAMEFNARQSVRRKMTVKGVRKLECTYNPFTDTYNPHFHFILEGLEQSEMLVDYWVKQNIKAGIEISEEAQDYRKCNAGSMTELFKYFTKLVSSKGGVKRYTTAPALDNIFTAMKGRRVYQPIGGVKKKQVSEDVDTLKAEILTEVVGSLETDIWLWSENDWFSQSTGENLCGYMPSDNDKKYGDLIYSKRKE